MSMWAFTASWLTPTPLFLLLNLVIGTIVIISRFGASKKPQHRLGSDNSAPVARPPSLIDRVKPFKFLNFKFPQYSPETDFLQTSEPEYNNPVDPPQLGRAPSLLKRVKSINFSSLYRSEQLNPETEFLHNIESSECNPNPIPYSDPGQVTDNKPMRSKSETVKLAGRALVKMKKSASERSMMSHAVEEEPEIVEKRRPATSRIERDGDDGVDAKADDFINMFKKQLKLQRLDSILRNKLGK